MAYNKWGVVTEKGTFRGWFSDREKAIEEAHAVARIDGCLAYVIMRHGYARYCTTTEYVSTLEP